MMASPSVDNAKPDKIDVAPCLSILLICLLTIPFVRVGLSVVAIILLLMTNICIFAARSRRKAIINAGIVWLAGMIILILLVPHISRAGEAARRVQCRNILHQIAIAMHNYQDEYGSLPPAALTDADGKPMHSWRVLILPFLDEKPLYEEYDFSQPWNSPENIRLVEKIPETYICPRDYGRPRGTTSYVAVVNADAPSRMRKSNNGGNQTNAPTPDTIQITETVRRDIEWTAPRDFVIGRELPNEFPNLHETEIGWFHRTSGHHVLYTDATVNYLEDTPQLDHTKVTEAIILVLTILIFIVSCIVFLKPRLDGREPGKSEYLRLAD